jgi:hypothetical protein
MAADMVAKPFLSQPGVSRSASGAFVVFGLVSALCLMALVLIGVTVDAQDPAERAEAAYRIVVENGTALERCEAAGKVVDAHLDRLDAQAYEEWTWVRKADCHDAGF